jgi:hypothetical protein
MANTFSLLTAPESPLESETEEMIIAADIRLLKLIEQISWKRNKDGPLRERPLRERTAKFPTTFLEGLRARQLDDESGLGE